MNVTFLENDIWVVSPNGRVDSAGARTLEESIAGLFNERHWRIVVDFTDVSYMSSAGLRVLIVALRRAQTTGGLIVLAGVSPTVLELVKMSGLDQIFEFFPDVPAAVQRLRTTGGAD